MRARQQQQQALQLSARVVVFSQFRPAKRESRVVPRRAERRERRQRVQRCPQAGSTVNSRASPKSPRHRAAGKQDERCVAAERARESEEGSKLPGSVSVNGVSPVEPGLCNACLLAQVGGGLDCLGAASVELKHNAMCANRQAAAVGVRVRSRRCALLPCLTPFGYGSVGRRKADLSITALLRKGRV